MGVAYKHVLIHYTFSTLSSVLKFAPVSKAMPTSKVSLWRASLVDAAACGCSSMWMQQHVDAAGCYPSTLLHVKTVVYMKIFIEIIL